MGVSDRGDEASGDAIVRRGLFERVGLGRIGLLLPGAALLFRYGVMLNLAPQPFDRVVGLYIATLFVSGNSSAGSRSAQSEVRPS